MTMTRGEPLLRAAGSRAAASGVDAAEQAHAGAAAAPAVTTRQVMSLLSAAAARAAAELRDGVGLCLLGAALGVAALLAPLRVAARLFARCTGRDETPPPPHKRTVPLPPGHARGVPLWIAVSRSAAPQPAAGTSAAESAALLQSEQDALLKLHMRVFSPDADQAAAVAPAPLDATASPRLLAALRRAAAQGRAVLLLPPTGGAVETWVWTGTVAALTSAGYWALCLDLRGQGRSATPCGPYTIPELAADAAACVAHALGVSGSGSPNDAYVARAPHVLGWSLGAGVALQLAVDAPGCVRSLLLFGYTASFDDDATATCAAAACRAAVASPRLAAALGVVLHGMLLAALLRFRRQGSAADVAAARRAIHIANSHAGYVGTVSSWRPFDLTLQLGAGGVRCRMRHLHTAADALGGHTLEKKARDVALVGAAADVREQRGPWTHAWPFEHPPSFNAAVLEWLAQV